MIIKFIKPNQVQKLRLLMILYEQRPLSLKKIQQLLGVTYSSLNRVIESLNEDIKLFTGGECQIKSEFQMFYITNNQSSAYYNLRKRIFSHCLNESIEFNIFRQTLLSEIYINDLCERVNISKSYLYTKIKVINEQLAEYDVKLIISGSKIKLSGEPYVEIFFKVQMLKYLDSLGMFYSRDLEKYPEITGEVFRENKIKNLLAKDLYYAGIIRKVFLINQKKIYELRLPNNFIREMLNVIVDSNNLIADKWGKDDKDWVLYYNFLLRLLIPEIAKPISLKEVIGKKISQLENNEIATVAVALAEEYFTHYHESFVSFFENKYELIYLFSLQLIYIDLFGKDYRYRLTQNSRIAFSNRQSRPLSNEERKIRYFVNKAMGESLAYWTEEAKEDFILLISRLVRDIVYSNQVPTFNIFVENFSDVMGSYTVKRKIIDFFSKEHIRYVQTPDKADLVITDQLIASVENIPVFYFSDYASSSTWERLFMTISKASYQKFLSDYHIL